MVEDNLGISPLDPLGSQFGGINQPSLDVQGISPFEGQRLTDPKINFPMPKSFVPAVPGLNLTQPQQNIRQNIVGSPDNPAKPTNNDDLRQAHIDYVKAIGQAHKEKDSYAKIYSYDASPDGNAFYKRYMAYGAETFEKIGFSPLRDNEANFNAKTTMWDDWGRMMKHSFWPLFTRGFVSGPKSLGRMLQGDFSGSDLEDAEAYEEAAAIGQSSKTGVSAFFNNSFMNFGYTAGIITEAIVEELAMSALTAGTVGGTAPVLFARTYQNLGRIFKSFKGFDLIRQGIKPVTETLRRANNIEDARKIWAAAKSPNAKAFGRFINPLENTFEAVRSIKADNITGLASLSKTAGGLYRDVRNVNMAVSEARLEAGMVENSVYKELYNEHYRLTGEAPDNKTQQEMRQQAKDASYDTFFWNAALIYGTNKITFNNITGPRGGINRYIKSVTEDYAKVSGGKFGSLGKIVYDNAKEQFAFEARNLKNLAKSWYRQPGFKTAKETIGYLKANFSEGFQENFQEAIARTNEKFYIDSFSSPYRQSHEYAKGVGRYLIKSKGEYFGEELAEEFTSAQGRETFASGFFMGMFAYPLNKAVPFLSENINRFRDAETYQKYKDMKIKQTQGLVDILNDVDIKDFLNSKLFTASAQDLLQIRKESEGDKKTSLDTEFESLIKSVSAMMDTGTTKYFTETLENFLNFSDEEFAKEFGISQEEIPAFKTRINNSIQRINDIEKNFNYYKEKFPNPVNDVNMDDMDPNSDEYKDLVALKFGWDLAVENAVFFKESFNDTMSRMVDIMNKFTSTTFMKNTSQSEMRLLFEPDIRLKEELTALSKEVEFLEAQENKDSTAQETLRKKKRKLEDMEKFSNAYRVFDIFFNRQKYYKNLRTKEEYKDKTDEELAELFDQDLGARDNEENQLKIIADLKVAFDSYMNNLAEDANDYTFDENLEEAFKLLLDHYKLGSEAQAMGYFINMLHNPQNFNELAERNRQWMRNLYENRSEYYDQMVKREIENIEDNALLNRLADKGIFISVEDLEAWKKDRTLPEEFYDNVNKKVIIEGTPEYNKLIEFFMLAANASLKDVDVQTPVLNKELQAKLNELDAKMQSEIDALDKEEKVNVIASILPTDKSTFFTISKIAKESKPGEIINAINTKNETVVFTKSDEDILLDESGEQASGKMRFVEAERTMITYEANPDEIAVIEERYNKLKQDLINEYEDKKANVKKPEVYEDQTIEDIKANDPDLYNELFQAFETSTIDDLGKEGYDALTDTQKENLFTKYIASAQGKLIIDEYNQKKKVEESIDEIETEEFEVKIGDKIISTEGKDIKTLKSYIKSFVKASEEINKKSIITEEDKLKLLSFQNTINNLQGLIAKRGSQGMPEAMKNAVKEIEKLVKLQKQVVKQDLKSITIPEANRDLSKWPSGETRFNKFGTSVERTEGGFIIDGKTYSEEDKNPSIQRLASSAIYSKNPLETPNAYVINGETHERVSNVIKSAFDPFGYSDAEVIENVFNRTLGATPLTETSINSFIEELRKESPGGFNSETYDQLKNILLTIYDSSQLGIETISTTPVSTNAKADIEAKKAEIEKYGKQYKLAGLLGKLLKNKDLEKNKYYVRVRISSEMVPTDAEIVRFTGEFYNIQLASGFAGAGATKMASVSLPKIIDSKGNVIENVIPESLGIFYELPTFSIDDKKSVLNALKQANYINFGKNPKQSEIGIKNWNSESKSFDLYYYDKNFKVKKTSLVVEDDVNTTASNFLNNYYNAELAALGTTDTKAKAIEELESRINRATMHYKNMTYGSKEISHSPKVRASYKKDAAIALKELNDLKAELALLKSAEVTTDITESQDSLRNFVLNTVSEITYEPAKVIGNYFDDQVKLILENKPAVRDPQRISEQAFNDMFNPKTGYINDIANRASQGEFKVFTDLVVWTEFQDAEGNTKRVAGEIDMLVVDTDGKIFIIDLKTGMSSKWTLYHKPDTFGNDKKKDNTLQQVSYSNLLFNQLDLISQIGVLPIQVKYNEETSFVEEAGRPTTKQLFANDDMTILKNNKSFTIPLNKEEQIYIKDENGNPVSITAQDLMDSLIPRKTLVVPADNRTSGSDEESPATKKPEKELKTKATREQKRLFDTLKKQIEKTEIANLDALSIEISLTHLAEEITDEMKTELLQLIDDKISDSFVEAFESSEIIPTLNDKLVLAQDVFTTQTIGKKPMDVSFESGTEFTVVKTDDKAKMVTLEGIFENKKVKIMVSNAELNESFMKEDVIGVTDVISTEVEDVVDSTTLEIMNASEGNINSFKNDREAKVKNKEQAKTESSKKVLDELAKLPKCGKQ